MFEPKFRARLARILVMGSLVAWPVTQLTIFSDEPPGILALSWLALILTLADIAATTDVREKAGDDP